MTANYINHIALVLDASLSMRGLESELIAVADAEIAHLAQRSQELDQETRVTVYTFNDPDRIRCVIYDKDVLRLPSIKAHYVVGGRGTALIDATMKSQLDLEQTAQLYGDHAFLTYVLTDGQENYSRAYGSEYLRVRLKDQPENWTVACMVPNQRGVFEAKSHGFTAGNVAVWDATRREGVVEMGKTMRRGTENFMVNRSKGIRGSNTLFAGGVDQVNTVKVRASQGFKPLDKDTYRLVVVGDPDQVPQQIRPYVELTTGQPYRTGSAFYELTKPEKIQPQKHILVRNRRSGRVYAGVDARALLNLPDHEVRVKPAHNPEFQIFVQSTSVNRKLVPGTRLLIMHKV